MQIFVPEAPGTKTTINRSQYLHLHFLQRMQDDYLPGLP